MLRVLASPRMTERVPQSKAKKESKHCISNLTYGQNIVSLGGGGGWLAFEQPKNHFIMVWETTMFFSGETRNFVPKSQSLPGNSPWQDFLPVFVVFVFLSSFY